MNIGLLLPSVIYAVVGYEINIYFHNLVTTINPYNYAYEVKASVGRTDAMRWHWIPEAPGTQKVVVSVWNDDGKVAEAEATIIVSPADAGSNRELTILEIGASCMAGMGHCDALHAHFQPEGNPKLIMLGSHGPGYTPLVPGGPATESYGGWTWKTFFTKTQTKQLANDGLHPARPYDVPSPFLFKDGDEFVFDFARYLDKYCNGRKPDAVLFELGVNGLFSCKTDEELKEKLDNDIMPYMERMMVEIRKVAPNAKFGVELIPTGSTSQDAFGANYGTTQSRRRWLINAFTMYRRYMEKAEEIGYDTIPAYINYDCNLNYPTKSEPAFQGSSTMVNSPSNALHPTKDGHRQWTDSEYFWLKYILANQN